MGEAAWSCLLHAVNSVLRSRTGAGGMRDQQHAVGLLFIWFICQFFIPEEAETSFTALCAREELKLEWRKGWGRYCEPRVVSERGGGGKGSGGSVSSSLCLELSWQESRQPWGLWQLNSLT